jgi:hypothetical protein
MGADAGRKEGRTRYPRADPKELMGFGRGVTQEREARDQELEALIPALARVFIIIVIGLSASFWVPFAWKAARS